MRIGACLLLKDGYCYQSYRWRYLRPLGSLQNAVSALEDRQVDEISIIRYCRSDQDNTSLYSDIELVSNLDCITPLSFGGGIRDVHVLKKLHQLPIERILISSAFFEKNISLVEEAISIFGKQAIIAVLPYRLNRNKLEYYCCRDQKFRHIDLNFIDNYSNEVMLYNTDQEGLSFLDYPDIRHLYPFKNSKVILSGGINRHFIKKIRHEGFAAVSIDNSSLHHEFNFYQL
tara:strand:+ start:1928 stop:2617 length:690 start_codon:yes stop_codon:yes gene_type:complete